MCDSCNAESAVLQEVGPDCGSVIERVLVFTVFEEYRIREVEDGHVSASSFGEPYPFRAYRREPIVLVFVREPSGDLKRIAIEGGPPKFQRIEVECRMTCHFEFLGVRWSLPCAEGCTFSRDHFPQRELENRLTDLVGIGL